MTNRSPVVLVTGVSSGIGRAVASAFAEKGFEVFGTSRNPRTAEPVAGVELVQLDVTDDKSVSAAVFTVVQRAGRIDVPGQQRRRRCLRRRGGARRCTTGMILPSSRGSW